MAGASSQTFEKYRGNSNFRKHKIECLLLSAIDTLWGRRTMQGWEWSIIYLSHVWKPEVFLSSILRLSPSKAGGWNLLRRPLLDFFFFNHHKFVLPILKFHTNRIIKCVALFSLVSLLIIDLWDLSMLLSLEVVYSFNCCVILKGRENMLVFL